MRIELNNIFYLSFGIIIYLRKGINWILKGRKAGSLIGTGYTLIPEKQRKANRLNSISEILLGTIMIVAGIINQDVLLILSGIFIIPNSLAYMLQKNKIHEIGYLYNGGIKIQGSYHLWDDLKVNRLTDQIVEFTYRNKDYHLYLYEKADIEGITMRNYQR